MGNHWDLGKNKDPFQACSPKLLKTEKNVVQSTMAISMGRRKKISFIVRDSNLIRSMIDSRQISMS